MLGFEGVICQNARSSSHQANLRINYLWFKNKPLYHSISYSAKLLDFLENIWTPQVVWGYSKESQIQF